MLKFSDAVQPGPEVLHQIPLCPRVACVHVCLRASILVCVHALLKFEFEKFEACSVQCVYGMHAFQNDCYGCVIVIDVIPYNY